MRGFKGLVFLFIVTITLTSCNLSKSELQSSVDRTFESKQLTIPFENDKVSHLNILDTDESSILYVNMFNDELERTRTHKIYKHDIESDKTEEMLSIEDRNFILSAVEDENGIYVISANYQEDQTITYVLQYFNGHDEETLLSGTFVDWDHEPQLRKAEKDVKVLVFSQFESDIFTQVDKYSYSILDLTNRNNLINVEYDKSDFESIKSIEGFRGELSKGEVMFIENTLNEKKTSKFYLEEEGKKQYNEIDDIEVFDVIELEDYLVFNSSDLDFKLHLGFFGNDDQAYLVNTNGLYTKVVNFTYNNQKGALVAKVPITIGDIYANEKVEEIKYYFMSIEDNILSLEDVKLFSKGNVFNPGNHEFITERINNNNKEMTLEILRRK